MGAKDAQVAVMQFVIFLLVGVLATATQYLVYGVGLGWLRVPAVALSSMGYLAGSIVSYLFNYHFTFRSRGLHAAALPKFYVMVAVAFVINAALVGLLVDSAGLNPWLGQFVATVVCLGWNYAVSRSWVFRK